MDDYRIGYGKPPQSGKIKEGEVRNPWGRAGRPDRRKTPPADRTDSELLDAVAIEPVEYEGGQITRREAGVRAAWAAAIKGKSWAIKAVSAWGLAGSAEKGGVIELPVNGPLDEWCVHTALAELEERQAHARKAKLRSQKRKSRKKRNKPQPLVLRSEAEYFAQIEREMVCVGGRTMTRRELRIRALNSLAAKGNVAARRAIERLNAQAIVNSKIGSLVVPFVATIEEWEAAGERQQAKYRSQDLSEIEMAE